MSYTTLKVKTRADLDQCIRERRKDQRNRSMRIKKVCDAIEGFCEEVCYWKEPDGYVNTMCGYATDQFFRIPHSLRPYRCPYCGRRVIAQFDILKEEGV